MMSYRGSRLAEIHLPLGTVWLLETLAESKGQQALYEARPGCALAPGEQKIGINHINVVINVVTKPGRIDHSTAGAQHAFKLFWDKGKLFRLRHCRSMGTTPKKG